MDKNEAKELISKYLQGTATPEERLLVEQWFNLDLEANPYVPAGERIEQAGERIRAKLLNHIQSQGYPERNVRLWPRIVAAASVIIALSAGGYFILHKQPHNQLVVQDQPHDIAPGKNQATLTLANGQKIILKPSLRGQIAQQGNTTVQAGSGNAITYTGTNAPEAKVEYNTMATARGEMSPYPLVLQDGTKVWLNSASSITFPTSFTGDHRDVKITGEALFEVAHNEKHPFRVDVNGQTIEDIGTIFNINAYDDEPSIKTTLAEGSVRVMKNDQSAVLKPGQQAITHVSANKILVRTANVDDVMAWKNGQTSFNDEDIQEIMRQVSRWYNMDIVYQGNVPETSFTGGISRKSNLSSVLKILELNNIHFTVEGRKLIVKP